MIKFINNLHLVINMSEPKRIPNINNYIFEIIDNELILTPKKKYITESELALTDIYGSEIQKCLIKNGDEIISSRIATPSRRLRYARVLIDIWKSIPIQVILDNSKFNFKLTKEAGKGYQWCPEINMSFSTRDAKRSLKEIINMIKVNKYTLDISIKLKKEAEKEAEIIYFKI